MQKIIKAHNNKIINDSKIQSNDDICNCRNKNNCPLPGKCTIKNVIYQANVITDNDNKGYIGLTSTTFKTRYTGHKASFTNPQKRNSTELSKYIWTLKDTNTPYQLKWKILRRAQPYSPRSKRCNLCLWEKLFIITNRNSIMNSRSELISTCRHRNKFLLSEYG